MFVIHVRNVEEALLTGLDLISQHPSEETRNGPARAFPGPVTTIYERPTERVLFNERRDANPYFHFFEALWMIAGRNDVEYPARFSAQIANYSDDGVTFHGAYGHRWRKHFGYDQLAAIAEALIINPNDRRIVLQMWDPHVDLGREGKDFPCNTAAKFRISQGRLDMTVENRSNDMIWGAYGANAVHFSMLQEVMASWIGVPVGMYWQISTNLHAYDSTFEKVYHDHVMPNRYYETQSVMPFQMVNTPIDQWMQELNMFLDAGDSVMGYQDPFFKRVAAPLLRSHRLYKEKRYEEARIAVIDCMATDWAQACFDWLNRREAAAKAKKA